MSHARLIPAELAQHSVESLHAMHGTARSWIYWISLLLVIGGLVSLPLIEVDVSFSAPGIVRPATERVELRLPIGGRVARVLARDNDAVVAGQPLLEIETPDLDERLARNRVLQEEKKAVLAALEQLSTIRIDGDAVFSEAEDGNEPAAIRALRQEFIQLKAQLDGYRVAEAKAGTELARARALAEKGIATQRELDDARYALERVQADGRLAIEQARTRWHARREEESLTVANLASEEARLTAERAQAVLRSPSGGTLQGLFGIDAGVVVGTGQVVGVISPDVCLLVETLVSTRDIGLVRRGQPVRLQIDAFPYTQWGALDGRVYAVAADSSWAPESIRPIFKVTIEPTGLQLKLPNGGIGTLSKGMTTSVRFVTARRSLFQIFYQDASEHLDPRIITRSLAN